VSRDRDFKDRRARKSKGRDANNVPGRADAEGEGNRTAFQDDSVGSRTDTGTTKSRRIQAAKPDALRDSDTVQNDFTITNRTQSAANGGDDFSVTESDGTPARHGRADSSRQMTPEGAQPRQRGSRYVQQFADGAPDAVKTPEPKPSKLAFSADELPPEAVAAKLTENRKMVVGDTSASKVKPKPKVSASQRNAAAKKHLRFEGEVKPQTKVTGKSRKASNPQVAVGSALANLHGKIRREDDGNVGVKAANEMAAGAENTGRTVLRMKRSAAARKRSGAVKDMRTGPFSPYAKGGVKAGGRQAARAAQKRTVKKGYAAGTRSAAPLARRAADGVRQVASRIALAAKSHPAAIAVIAVLAILVFFIVSTFSSCSGIGVGAGGSIFASTYLAEDAVIDDAELAYTEWETDLLIKANSAEATHRGYDEYRYSIGDISHSPFELMAYLTAMYQDFTGVEAEAALRTVFARQYSLEYLPETEVRYRTETRTDPQTGEDVEVTVAYEWHILNVRLTANSFTDIAVSLMDADALAHYQVLTASRGNRQYVANVFQSEWLTHISSYYGYRLHPSTGAKEYHRGIDISFPAGTKVLAGHDGKVTSAGDSGSFGLLVQIDQTLTDGSVLSTRYAHLSHVSVHNGQQVKQGDVIGEVGSTGDSTGPHLHLEVLKNGRNLNPIYFAETGASKDDSGIPGSSGGPVIPPYPGAPMTDARYTALITEAQKHLGKPYVFGASGPGSFDCSGFVCYSLNHSGAASVGRTTAQGLFNMTTPVSRANAKPGDLIFFTGTYSAGTPVTHIGIYIGNGKMIHAGDPVQYADIDTSYWQQHFYAFGRL
jgi:murein DD-endopeptidase MepM/ murein hydrolase activator NlpD